MNRPATMPPLSGQILATGSAIETSPELEAAMVALLDLISAHQRFLVVSHACPDGDAVGSTLAMGLLLEHLGKEVVFFNVDAVPYNFRFLPGADRWATSVADEATFEVTIVLDCAEKHRLGDQFPDQGLGQRVAVIDHHKTWDPDFADVYFRDPTAAATGELIFRLAERLGALTQPIAEALYCCMVTDTGSFRYSNTSRTAFRIAGELVAAGANPWHMTSNIYENQPRERLELLCRVLNTLAVSNCGRLAFLRLESQMIEGLGNVQDLTDGFINYARSIKGVEVATQLRENGDGSWRVSFRSRGKVDVSALAQRFGGGGHHNAAGCQISGTPEAIQDLLAQALTELIDDPA
jgi:bifunctional oligoribonuclease and PAP phosphatase NrnA